MTTERLRRSLAHEIVHIIRALTNKNLWEGFENKAKEHGLDPSEKDYIGGFKVALNKQGSEAIGELFAALVEYKSVNGKNPTIEDLIPEIRNRLEKTLNKFTKKDDSKKPNQRYLAAKIALLDHLVKLSEQGFGEVEAERLVALGCFGYVSLEKAEELIKLGIISPEKFDKILKVIRTISEWLTSPSESGFQIETQNT